MTRSSTARQLINSELRTRSQNKHAKKMIDEHTPPEEKANLAIDFHCECSSDDCTERITMTLQEYETLHSTEAKFVIAKGHEALLVEKITEFNPNNAVVEKYAL